jgi:Ca2+/H+ antiporter, TMEM165/GDT1 family
MNFAVVAIAFGVIFLAELPDKSMIASLVLGSRYRALYVWIGAAAAFAVHVVIAVAAGGALGLLPHRLVQGIVAVLFLGGAAVLFFSSEGQTEPVSVDEAGNAVPEVAAPTLRRVASVSFVVIFVGEWGDITQIAAANLTAKYHDPLAVGAGALLGLWSVVALGVVVGSKIVRYVPLALVRRITGVILVVLGVLSALAAIRG